MKNTQKINDIGRIVSDVKLELMFIQRDIKQIRKWMLFPDQLKTDIEVERIMRKSVTKRKV